MGIAENTESTEKYKDYPESALTGKIIQTAIEVHKTLGPGFLENIYENVLIYKLKQQGLKVENQKLISIVYKKAAVGEYRLDLLVEDKVIVENKTVKVFDDIHQAEILHLFKFYIFITKFLSSKI